MKSLKTLDALIDHLKHLPSVGGKSAERMAYAMLLWDEEELHDFGQVLEQLKKNIHPCPMCGVYTEDEVCEICSSPERNHKVLMVVSYPKDIHAFEAMGTFQGVYHCLNGVLSIQSGVGYQDLNLNGLVERIEKDAIEEVILATNPTIEGETTALFIAKLLEKMPVRVTRLAYGLPMGGQVDYADSMTLSKALQGRTNMKE